ncbi:hypothetical protein [Amycolatopsis samaneae]|uniref:Uncharacterized protein n=1 Tax=Amycolatopsis samaneae TaxID=664691 RepID=A0ABW5GP55_9PSEU
MLFILDRLGDPCQDGADVPPGAVRTIRSQRKLQKLDFLVRNPDYLANAIISACEEGRLPAERLLDAKKILFEREPELHTYRMLRNQHGAYEFLDDAMSVLRHLGLVQVRRVGRITDSHVKRRNYYLLEAGAEQAMRLRDEEPILAWYDEQTAYAADAVRGLSAEQMKRWQYDQPEYASTPLGQLIGGIAERVERRLEAALAEKGLG